MVTFYYKNMSFCFNRSTSFDLELPDVNFTLEKYQTDRCLETNYIVFRHLDVVFYYKYSFWAFNAIILISNAIKDKYMDMLISNIVIPGLMVPQVKPTEKNPSSVSNQQQHHQHHFQDRSGSSSTNTPPLHTTGDSVQPTTSLPVLTPQLLMKSLTSMPLPPKPSDLTSQEKN